MKSAAGASSSEIIEETAKSQDITQSQSLEESKDAATASAGNKDDVSFNTLLNDSELSFNPSVAPGESQQPESKKPVAEAGASPSQVVGPAMTRSQRPNKKELNQLKDLTDKLSETAMRMTEVETEYETYREKTQTEIIELKMQKENAESKLATYSGYDDLVAQLKEAQFKLA